MNKKAQYRYLIAVVIGLLFLVAVFPLFGGVKQTAVDMTDHKICAESVNAYTKAKVGSLSFNTALKCPLTFESAVETNADDAVKLLANRIVLVWDEFQAGKARLFPTSLLETQSYCIFRYVEEFKNPDKIDKIPMTRLITELQTTYIKRDGKEISALEYIQGQKTEDLDNVDFEKLTRFIIDPQVPQAVVLIYTKFDSLTKFFYKWGLVGTTAGFALGAIFTAVGIVFAPFTSGVSTLLTKVGIFILVIAVAGGVTGAWLSSSIMIASGEGINQGYDIGIMLVPYDKTYIESLPCTYLPGDQDILTGGNNEQKGS